MLGSGAIAGLCIGVALVGLIIGLIFGYMLAIKQFKKQQKQNPIITEQQIKTMYKQMGRPVSDKKIKEIMQGIKNNK